MNAAYDADLSDTDDPQSPGGLTKLGWDDEWLEVAEANPLMGFGAQPARVVRTERTCATVACDDGDRIVQVSGLSVGDWVLTDSEWVAEPLPRRSVLARQGVDKTSADQVLAANVDVLLICEPADRDPSVGRIERFNVLAHAGGVTPVVVFTKTDLAAPGVVEHVMKSLPGLAWLTVDATDTDSVARLAAALGETSDGGVITYALVGPSGAGKSTLTNALIGEEVAATGDVRGDGKGQHTTTGRQLHVAPGVGLVIDTAGLRSVGVVGDAVGVDEAFAEITALLGSCKYSDCEHRTEPDCAILDAVDAGHITRERYDRYAKLLREAAFHAERGTAAYRAKMRDAGRVAARRKRGAMERKGRR